MKLYNKTISAVLLAALFLSPSCDKMGQEDLQEMTISTEKIDMLAEGGEETVTVTTPDIWTSEVSEPWILVTPANGEGTTKCTVFIDDTVEGAERQGKIIFTSKSNGVVSKKVVDIVQMGYEKVIKLDKEVIEIESTAGFNHRFLKTKIVTNVEAFKLVITDSLTHQPAEWLASSQNEYHPELEFGARPQQQEIRLDWKLNTEDVRRTAEVKFYSLEDLENKKTTEIEPKAVLKVRQKAAPTIGDNRGGDSLALVLIQERLAVMGEHWDTAENMRNWDGVVLWRETDKNLPCPEAIGRVRAASFAMFSTEESLPSEVRHLKYAETLYFYSNVNTMLKSIHLGTELCDLQYLKNLTIGAYGLVSLPAEFVKLGDSLESLDLGANNFADIPSILNQQNFPKLKALTFLGNRRWTLTDLRKATDAIRYPDGIGFHINTNYNNSLRNLFLWDNLEYLRLSANYMEGPIPDFQVGETVNGHRIESYKKEDLAALKDTVSWLLETPEGQKVPKILPKMKHLFINLNFFSGKIPDWILYHPYLIDWIPSMLVFNQMEKSIDSEGTVSGFTNEPSTFDYYYDVFPLYRGKYEMKEEID